MHNAEVYHRNNSLQRRDASDCLEEYVNKIKWKKVGERVIDIGCGDGTVTAKLLKEHIPDGLEILIGCDINQKMVAFANGQYSDAKTAFKVLDIGGCLPEEYKGSFDHVFSFYTLHWVKNQKAAFTNIYEMMSEGGECFLIFLAFTPIISAYRILAKSNKWGSLLKNIESFTSPYQDSQEPEKEVRKLMNQIGFSDISVKCHDKFYAFENTESIKEAVRAINPFPMSKDTFDNFMLEYLDVLQDLHLINKEYDGSTVSVKTDYKLLVIHGTKHTSVGNHIAKIE